MCESSLQSTDLPSYSTCFCSLLFRVCYYSAIARSGMWLYLIYPLENKGKEWKNFRNWKNLLGLSKPKINAQGINVLPSSHSAGLRSTIECSLPHKAAHSILDLSDHLKYFPSVCSKTSSFKLSLLSSSSNPQGHTKWVQLSFPTKSLASQVEAVVSASPSSRCSAGYLGLSWFRSPSLDQDPVLT